MRLGKARTGVGMVLVLALGLAGCQDDGGSPESRTSAGQGSVRVVAAFYPLAEAARKVGGDRVAVVNLTGAGVEPHDLELSPKQVDQIEDADVVLYLGRDFQPAIADVAARSQGVKVDLLEDMPLLAESRDDEDADDSGDDAETSGPHADPHVWLDPSLFGEEIVRRVGLALTEADPGSAAAYRAAGDDYRADLKLLDTDFRYGLRNCARRTFVTAHAAFGYLAAHYDLEQHAIAGLSPEIEPNPRRMAELADLVKGTGTTTIYTETLVSSKVADTLARETGVHIGVLNPLEGLTEAQVKAGADYRSVMTENLQALVDGLGCTDPTR